MEVIFEIILIKENQFQMKIYLCTFIIGSELFLVGKNSIHSKKIPRYLTIMIPIQNLKN